MGQTLRVLLVEDCDDDALLVQRHLKRGGYELLLTRVDNERDMRTALDEPGWDVILCDYNMPLFSGPRALEVVRERALETPFIIVTAALGDEAAAAIMKAGAHDYVLKHKLVRLIPVVQRSLKEAEVRCERQRALKSLKESEERYRALFERTLDCILIVDFEGHILDVNPAALDLLGYSSAELSALHYREIFAPGQFERVARELAELIDGGAIKPPQQIELLCHDGSHLIVEAIVTLLFNDGKPYAIQAVGRDISARIAAAKALREREERLRQITDHMLDMITLTDQGGQILWASPSHVRVLGIAPEQIVGHSIFERVHPDHLDDVKNAIAAGLSEGRLEFRYRDSLDNYLWIESFGRVVHDDEGAFVGAVFGSRDVTERRLASEAMRASEENLAATLNSMADGVIATDTKGLIVRMNPAAEHLIGCDLQSVRGQSLASVYRVLNVDDGTLVEDVLSALQKAANTGRSTRRLLVGPNGQTRTVDDSSALIQGRGRSGGGLVLVFRDVSEQIMLEQQVRLAQRMQDLGRLAGGVAHEFHNLLGVISGYCDVISSELRNDDPVGDDLREIAAAAERGGELTRQLLAFSSERVSAARVIDLNEVVCGVVPMLRRIVCEDIELELKCNDKPCLVNVDPGQLEHVLLTLALNARDSMPRGGTLGVDIRVLDSTPSKDEQEGTDEGAVQVTIWDTAFIAREQLTLQHAATLHLIERDNAGPGYATVASAMHQAGGQISVHHSLAQGCRFVLQLPLVDKSHNNNVASASIGDGETVLVVEDDNALLQLLCRVLRRSGYRVLEARHGNQAIAVMERHQPKLDLLVTDVVLPQFSGRELYQRLSAKHQELRVLYMSGYTAQVVAERGIEHGSAPFIHKPFSAQDLLGKVREVLSTVTTRSSDVGV